MSSFPIKAMPPDLGAFEYIETDYNGDGAVDYIDLEYQFSHWLQDDSDGLVDFLDFAGVSGELAVIRFKGTRTRQVRNRNGSRVALIIAFEQQVADFCILAMKANQP